MRQGSARSRGRRQTVNFILFEANMVPNFQSCAVGETTSSSEKLLGVEEVIPILKKAAELPGKGPLATASMLICLSHCLNRTSHILLVPKSLREFGLSRTTAYRSLVQLASLGIISVSRHKGQGPMVSFIHPTAPGGTK
jgi:hypothetical protein